MRQAVRLNAVDSLVVTLSGVTVLGRGNSGGLCCCSGVILIRTNEGGQVHSLTLGINHCRLAQRHGQRLVAGDLGDEGGDLTGLLSAWRNWAGSMPYCWAVWKRNSRSSS